MIEGQALKYGDNISTDLLIPGRYMYLRSNLPELAKHACEDLDPGFVNRVQEGDILVAGRNFGLGSSREHAAIVLKMNGISAVVAESVARIFYRNAINIGLPVVITDTVQIREGDLLTVDPRSGYLSNRRSGIKQLFKPLPPEMMRILDAGGLIAYIKQHGDLHP
jgi:3-isopropylmalate/(R)-2-methylmalate dehydratase small subunit